MDRGPARAAGGLLAEERKLLALLAQASGALVAAPPDVDLRSFAVRRFDSFDGVQIAYEVFGAGPDVLLLHGFGADHVINWVTPGVVDALVAADRRVIALDARGHGASAKPHDPKAYAGDAMANDARALLDHLAVEEVDVVGYSMGSLVSLRLVPDEPRTRGSSSGGSAAAGAR